MLILDMQMPRACDECPMLDESGDYPMCRITQETRGYTFNTREKRMDRCPIKGEVVRCEDCKYYQKVYGGVPLGEVGHCICHSFETVPDWFCADGERKSQ